MEVIPEPVRFICLPLERRSTEGKATTMISTTWHSWIRWLPAPVVWAFDRRDERLEQLPNDGVAHRSEQAGDDGCPGRVNA